MTKWWGTNMLDLENTSTKEAELHQVCERVLSSCNTVIRWIQDKVTSPSLFQVTVSALRWCLCSLRCVRDKNDSPQHWSFECATLTSCWLKRGCYKVCHFLENIFMFTVRQQPERRKGGKFRERQSLNNEENGVEEFYPGDSLSCASKKLASSFDHHGSLWHRRCNMTYSPK